jgi:glycine cleavage system transcriptional repressor
MLLTARQLSKACLDGRQIPGTLPDSIPFVAEQNMQQYLAITAIGPDRAGLVRDLSKAVADAGGNIEESRMSALGADFAMLILVSGNWHTIAQTRDSLETLGNAGELTVTIRKTDRTPAEQQAIPYVFDIIALDQEGIVLGLSGFFSTRGMQIAEMNTRRYNAPHTGSAMFSVQMTVSVPSKQSIATLRDEFHEYCDERNLDAVIEPAQR